MTQQTERYRRAACRACPHHDCGPNAKFAGKGVITAASRCTINGQPITALVARNEANCPDAPPRWLMAEAQERPTLPRPQPIAPGTATVRRCGCCDPPTKADDGPALNARPPMPALPPVEERPQTPQ